VRLEASTKPHVHNLIHEFLINMAFTMAYPNFKKGLKMVFGPLGVKIGDAHNSAKEVLSFMASHGSHGFTTT
jgi:hypothetical protein